MTKLQKQIEKWLLRKTTATSIRRVGELPIAIASTVGSVRDENQDRVAALRFMDRGRQEFLVIAVCDGMGGMVDGAKCASSALATFFSSFIEQDFVSSIEHRFERAAFYANNAVFDQYRGKGGATISAVLIDSSNNIFTLNIGDSRIYKLNHSKQLIQLTVDDTIAGQMAVRTKEYSDRGELLQYVGLGPSVEVHVTKEKRQLTSSETFVITSDGVHYLPLGVLQALLVNAPDQALAAKRLIDTAVWCGGHDNASVAVVCSNGVFDPLEDDDVAFVWDPFGEVQITIERAYNKLPKFTPIPQTQPEVVEVAPKLKRAPRSKTTEKKKSGGQRGKAVEAQKEPPQLRMNFPKKDVGSDD